MHLMKTIIINSSPEEAYLFWHDYENLHRFMENVESIRKIAPKTYRWKAKTFGGISAEWDAEIIIEIPFSKIAWKTITGSNFESSGSVTFNIATGGRGTLVRVEMDYTVPAGKIGETIAKFFGDDPGQQLMKTLRALKQILETGGIVISEASLSPGHPAQPPSDDEFNRFLVGREQGKEYPTAGEQV